MVGYAGATTAHVRLFIDVPLVYVHREPVDFRKAINGLVLIIEQSMLLSPYSEALFLFCNRRRDKLKAVWWDQTGFALWYKRLDESKFHWPRHAKNEVVVLSEEQLHWLLRGFDLSRMHPHKSLDYVAVS